MALSLLPRLLAAPARGVFAPADDGTDWWLFGVTLALAVATAVLAYAAWKALAQLKEAQKDRHVQVVMEFGRRWNSSMLVDALILESGYDADSLAALIDLARADPSKNPWRERRRREAERQIVILFRIPDFFEDLAFMAEFAALGDDSLATFKGLVCDEWAIWCKAVARMRDGGDGYSYTQFEALAERMDEVPDW